MTDPSEPQRDAGSAFAAELVKLLVQVAWADHDVAAAEIELLMDYARKQGLSDAEREQLHAMLTGKAPLTPPNLGLLKARRTDALRAVKDLLLVDKTMADEEEDVLSQIAALLG